MAKTSKPSASSKKHLARLEIERRQTRLIRNIAIGVIASVILVLIYGYLDLNYLQLRQPVAKIGDTVVTTREFQMRVRLTRQQLINRYVQIYQFAQVFGIDPSTDQNFSSQISQIQAQMNSPETLGQNVLDQVINEALIRQECARRGITVSPEEISAKIRGFFNYYPNGSPTPTITPTDVVEPTFSPEQLALVTLTPTPTQAPTRTPAPTPTLVANATATPVPSATPTYTPVPTATPYTAEGYQSEYDKSLENYKKLGMTEKDFSNLFENQIYRQKLYDLVTADVPHEEDMVWARHILVADEATAKKVYLRLLNGGDFSIIAAEVSTDPGTKDKGGDLGWFGKGQMIPEFEKPAFDLKVGQISEPIQSTYGWHIIQVLGHEMRPLTASQYQTAKDQAFNDFLAKLKSETQVETFDIWKNRVPAEPTLPPTQ